MERIEYLLNHPSTVEGSDLELLNNEIEKYPYFYSLRALKLAALKKIKDDSYENVLPLTATFSHNRKDLFEFIHNTQKEISFEAEQKDEILPIIKDEIIQEAETELEVAEFSKEVNDFLTEEDLIEELKPIEVENLTSTNPIEENFEEKNISEPTIESLIEDIKQDILPSQIDDELILFDLPENNPISPKIENSILIAENILQDKEIVNEGIIETIEIQKHPIEGKILEKPQEIEQVNLIGRVNENNFNNESNQIDQKKVSNINKFQIQNTYDVVKGKIKDENLYFTNESESIMTEQQEIVSPKTIENEVSENVDIDSLSEENISKTVEFKQKNENSSLSFNDWLKKSDDLNHPNAQKEMKYQIIDSFLEKNPKITPIKKIDIPESKIDVKEIKQTDFSDLMTETLAQIYIEQKQYEKAIKAYKILSLKYPEKNSLFANQIKEIENLKNSK